MCARLLTTEQTAAELGVTGEHVRRLAQTGRLPFINVGIGEKRPRMRFDPEDILAFKEKQRQVMPRRVSGKTPKARIGRRTSGSAVISFAARRAARTSATPALPPSESKKS